MSGGREPSRGSRSRTPKSGNLPDMSKTKYWGLRDIAEYLGIEYSSARTYHGRAEIHRRKDTVRPGDMPPPAERFGNSPVWEPATIVQWHAQRPGKGAFGGRPKKVTTEPVAEQAADTTDV